MDNHAKREEHFSTILHHVPKFIRAGDTKLSLTAAGAETNFKRTQNTQLARFARWQYLFLAMKLNGAGRGCVHLRHRL